MYQRVDKTTRKSVYHRHGGVCFYCGDPTWQPPWRPGYQARKQATVDHIHCKTHGGANDVSNYVLACEDCNNHRSSRYTAEEYFWLKNKDKDLAEVYHRILYVWATDRQLQRVSRPGNGTGLNRWIRAHIQLKQEQS